MTNRTSVVANRVPSASVLPPAVTSGKPGFLGIVMLDTQFPRPIGDIGNPLSWPVPVHQRVLRGVWPDKVVASAAGLRQNRVLPGFVAIVRQLERDGARAITTSCGLLVLLQRELQAAVKVPVVTSSLLQLPTLLERDQQVGVLTISSKHLGAEHLRTAGVPRDRLRDVLVQGVDAASEFATAILGNRDTMNLERAQADVVTAALMLKARSPQLRTVVLECTNMPPYAHAVREATGWSVCSLLDSRRLIETSFT